VGRSKRFLIWGGGGHGKVVADLVRATGNEVAGYVDRDPAKLGKAAEPGGARVEVLEDSFREALGDGTLPLHADAVALGVGDNAARLAALGIVPGELLPPLVHPSAIVSHSALLGVGTVVFPGAVVNAAARLGCAVIVNTRAVVEHDCMVGDAAHLSPGAVLCGGVHVGERSWIGAGAVVIPGVSVGAGVTVGAGAIVLKSVEDGTTVAGNPARALAPPAGTARTQ
jgi:sugar O-acyltransferase (sialic acid O-acetyltransferase NeuD family)